MVNGRIIELGRVCEQRPAPGSVQSARLPVTVMLQDEDPYRGGTGEHAWRLMPTLTGLTLAQAREAMRKAGFDNESKVRLYRVEEPGCTPNVICRSSPEGLGRAYVTTSVNIIMGLDPSAPPPKPAPMPVEPSEPPPPSGQPALTPPPKDVPPEPFF